MVPGPEPGGLLTRAGSLDRPERRMETQYEVMLIRAEVKAKKKSWIRGGLQASPERADRPFHILRLLLGLSVVIYLVVAHKTYRKACVDLLTYAKPARKGALW
jgi:hypothetical protein